MVVLDHVKHSSFLCSVSNFPFSTFLLSNCPCFNFPRSLFQLSGRARGRPRDPDRQKRHPWRSLGEPCLHYNSSRTLLGPIFGIFGPTREVSKIHAFLASLQNAQNRTINRPWSALERILDKCSLILGSFWH